METDSQPHSPGVPLIRLKRRQASQRKQKQKDNSPKKKDD